MMTVSYCCPFWGSEDLSVNAFFEKVLRENYEGVEINFPNEADFIHLFLNKIEQIRSNQKDFKFIAQQVLSSRKETPKEYTKRMVERLDFLASLHPDFINSHTGKDYYSFNENCFIIEAAENIAQKTGIPVYHEIHRGRFTFHGRSLLPYFEEFPNLKLTGDFSHWCNVSESLLFDQEEILEKVFPHVNHIHARIGSEQAPQVNNPFAPEWESHLKTYILWWQKIIDIQKKSETALTITPEFGPAPYMPVMPFTQQPLSNQREINSKMMQLLKNYLTL